MDNIKKLTTEDVQKKSFDILKDFKKICNDNGLKYMLAYGTCLGAVRHHGFIPWDDDVDVIMPRPDYIRLEKLIAHTPTTYQFLSLNTNKVYSSPLAKYHDPQTFADQHYGQIDNPKFGVYIDVFVIDGLPSNKFLRKFYFNLTCKIRRAWKYSVADWSYDANPFSRALKIMVSGPFKMVGYRFWARLYDSVCKIFDYNSHKYVGGVLFGEGYFKEVMQRELLDSTCEMLFEGEYFPIPRDYDKYLRQKYGNYMELPPVEKRVSKHGTDFYDIPLSEI